MKLNPINWADPNAHRLLVVAVSILLLLSSIVVAATNEPARMRMAQIGINAQAIESGAKTYMQYCSDCHGRKGFGIVRHGPALNNPQLFGHDYFPEITKQIDELKTQETSLIDRKRAIDATDALKNSIDARLTEIESTIAELDTKRKSDIKRAVDFGYDPQFPNRLDQVGWKGNLESFILTTLIHGRPVSISYWPQPMPAYSKEAHSTVVLEQYELENLTAYILNWDKGNDWTPDDLYAVNQFAILPTDFRWTDLCFDCVPRPPPLPPTGTNVKAISEELKTINGDAERGEQLYHAVVQATLTSTNLPCTGCHQKTANGVGPMTNGTYTRVVNERLKEAKFASFTVEEYLIDSIVNPSHYIVPGFQDLMVKNMGTEVLDPQDLADIVAYLMTQK